MDSVFEPMLERVLENRKQWELMNLRRITMGTSKETDVWFDRTFHVELY